jgi:hypothetical protein
LHLSNLMISGRTGWWRWLKSSKIYRWHVARMLYVLFSKYSDWM